MPADAARRERRAKQFGRPLSDLENNNGVTLPSTTPGSEPKDSSTKRSKKAASSAPVLQDPSSSRSASPASPSDPSAPADAGSKDKKSRFILFVGNLPFSATTEGVTAHFASVQPTAIRHATDKATGRSRGFAFLEFDDVKRMEACLVGMHRSMYREEWGVKAAEGEGVEGTKDVVMKDGLEAGAEAETGGAAAEHKYAREGWRRINVELTAGGGGKSETRKKRLRDKNAKLATERAKRAKRKDEKTKAKASDTGGDGAKKTSAKAGGDAESDGGVHLDVHPSRRAMVGRASARAH